MIKLLRKEAEHAARVRLKGHADRLSTARGAGERVPDATLAAYKDPIVKGALVEEACGKCGYCESKLLDTQFGDVEHIRPKAIWPNLQLDYENLVFACIRCNNAKNVRYDRESHHIDPYRDEPSAHLIAMGPLVWPRPEDTGPGRITEFVFDLNRQELLESRLSRLKAIKTLATEYAHANGQLKTLAYTALVEEAGRCAEYTMVVRAYLRISFPNEHF